MKTVWVVLGGKGRKNVHGATWKKEKTVFIRQICVQLQEFQSSVIPERASRKRFGTMSGLCASVPAKSPKGRGGGDPAGGEIGTQGWLGVRLTGWPGRV